MAGDIALIAALVVAGLLLFVLEICTPSFGLLAACALVTLGAAVWQGFVLSQTLGLVMIVALIVVVPFYLYLMVKLLPNTPLGRRLFLRSAAKGAGEGAPETEKHMSMVGKTGTTETLLRPSGAVRIDGQRVIAMAESGTIERGATVEVVRARGTDVVVRRVKEQEAES
jgi:membrane-bound serine protease (ClpP class)